MVWLVLAVLLHIVTEASALPSSSLGRDSPQWWTAHLDAERSTIEFGDQYAPTVIPMQQRFRAQCQCTDVFRVPGNFKIPMFVPHGECGATQVKIKLQTPGEGLSEGELRTAIGNPLKAKWAKVENHHFSDFEGRTNSPILGTPGGDIGQLINALSAFEEITGNELAPKDCARIFKRYLSQTEKISFYFMTDSTALHRLANDVEIDGLDLRETPDGNVKEKLLAGLVLPEHNGSRFLKELLLRPEDYDLRSGVTECAIKGFFETLWDKTNTESKKCRLVELDGVNSERALVYVKTSASCTNKNIAPLIQPKGSDYAMLVVHQVAAEVMRLELSQFMADLDEKVDAARIQDIMDSKATKFVEVAAKAIAKGKPVYEVTIM